MTRDIPARPARPPDRLPKERTLPSAPRSTAVIVACALLALVACSARASAADLESLIAQLEGRDCRYADDALAPCGENGFVQRRLRGLDPTGRYRCTLGAARCLERLGPEAGPAVPALIHALLEGPNDYDTGDGWIAARSAVAGALGAIGDRRAIDPLGEALARAVPGDRGPGARVPREPAARLALVEALGRFGPEAARHRGRVASVLGERNADDGYLARMREQYEHAAAVDLAVEDHRRRSPGQASFVVSHESVAEARVRLDPASARYRREFEVRSRDALASAAATALGRFGETDAVPLLIGTLPNPAAAEAAARALAVLGARSEEVSRGLRSVLLSPAHGPSARAAAAVALGRLGGRRDAGLLALGLPDPELTSGAAEGLAALGPLAADALPALVEVLEQPIHAQRSGLGVHYDLEATARLGDKVAAVRAIEAIGGPRASAALEPYARDPDIGHGVRKALIRLQADRSR